ncbi:hypothetical protein WG66_005252 [Moniliophthora roreri]|nr:hypothetical protein WG66_005252 [Moniliophthora roreri]
MQMELGQIFNGCDAIAPSKVSKALLPFRATGRRVMPFRSVVHETVMDAQSQLTRTSGEEQVSGLDNLHP